MPKDYVHRAQEDLQQRPTASHEKGQWQRISWKILLIFIALVVLFVFILIYFKLHHKISSTNTLIHQKPGAVAKQISVEKNTANDQSATPMIKFDFYTMLPKMSVNVVDETTQPAATAVVGTSYLLQLASLSNEEDAKSFQEKVNSLGYQTKLVTFMRGTTTWYRVQLGPFKDLNSAEVARDKLREQQINAILLSVTEGR